MSICSHSHKDRTALTYHQYPYLYPRYFLFLRHGRFEHFPVYFIMLIYNLGQMDHSIFFLEPNHQCLYLYPEYF